MLPLPIAATVIQQAALYCGPLGLRAALQAVRPIEAWPAAVFTRAMNRTVMGRGKKD